SARIYPAFIIRGQSAYNNLTWHIIRLPVLSVEYEQGFVVGEIHKTVRTAGCRPVLISCFIVALRIILHEGDAGKASLFTARKRRGSHRRRLRLCQKQKRAEQENQNPHV